MKKTKTRSKSNKQLVARLVAVSSLVIIFMPVLFAGQFFNIIPVVAAEEEEEDAFNVLPTYRYPEETATDGAVSEQLLGDQYENYNANNETTGVQKSERSRLLNSRDFYYNTRFQIDNGGNTTEYFRDVIGDPADFTEDLDGWVSKGTTTLTVDYGLLKVNLNSASEGFRRDLGDMTLNPIYTQLDIKIKADLPLTLRMIIEGKEADDNDDYLAVTTTWQDFSVIIDITRTDTGATYPGVRFETAGGYSTETNIWIDSVEIIGSLDYATHVEGGPESAWDWEESTEFFYDEFDNVSDFDDGTTENWTAYQQPGLTHVFTEGDDGWVYSYQTSAMFSTFECYNLSIDASVYKYFTFESALYIGDGGIDRIDVYDNASNLIASDDTNITGSDIHLFNEEFNANWTGTETGIVVNVTYISEVFTPIAKFNFTYLYSEELGDLEGFSGLEREYVNPAGYYTGVHRTVSEYDSLSTPSGLHIDSNGFTNVILIVWVSHDCRFTLKAQGSNGTNENVGDENVYSADGWTELNIDVSIDSDWQAYDYFTKFFFDVYTVYYTLGVQIELEYFLVTGHWSNTSAFKFSLLNDESEEGMYFQFNRYDYSTDEYSLTIDMLDAAGIALNYEIDFNYSRSVDGWLGLDVEWHLDKKTLKIEFEYENGTDILKTRSITDLYPLIGTTQLLLLKSGFPSLCLNNSMDPLARSLVLIDYIDADWDLLNWVEEEDDATWDPDVGIIGIGDQDTTSDFDAITPYGLMSSGDNFSDYINHYYWLDVDRFDGVSFDMHVETFSLEQDDIAYFYYTIYSVLTNGTLAEMFTVIFLSQNTLLTSQQVAFYIYDGQTDAYDFVFEDSGETNGTVQLSIYRESSTQLILDYRYTTSANELQGIATSIPDGFNMTKEYVMLVNYVIYTGVGAQDDYIQMKMGGFDTVRKDIFKAIVSAIISPIIGIIQLILTPVIWIMQVVARVISGGLKVLGDFLEPFITAIATILGAILGDIFDALGNLAQWIVDALVAAVEDIVDAVLVFMGDIIDAALAFLEDIFLALIEAVDIIITLVAAIVFAIYDGFWIALGVDPPPDIIALVLIILDVFVAIIAGLPALAADLLEVIFFWAVWIPIFMFAYNWLGPATSSDNIGDFGSNFVEIFTMDITGGFSLIGFNMPIPFGAVWLSILSLLGLGLI